MSTTWPQLLRRLVAGDDLPREDVAWAMDQVMAGQVPPAAAREQRAVVDAFRAAARDGDFEDLLRVLDPAVKLDCETAQGKVVLLGATEVAANARSAAGTASRGVSVYVNGLPGFLAFGPDGRPVSVMTFTIAGGRIVGMHVVTDPARLAAMEVLGAAGTESGGAEEV